MQNGTTTASLESSQRIALGVVLVVEITNSLFCSVQGL